MQQVMLAKRNPETLVAAMIKLQDNINTKKSGEKMDTLEE